MKCKNCRHDLVWDSFLLMWVHAKSIVGHLEVMCNAQERSNIPFKRIIVCGCTNPEPVEGGKEE